MDLHGVSFVVGDYRYTRRDEGWTMSHKDYDHRSRVSDHHAALVDRIGELTKQVEGLQLLQRKDMEKTLRRFSAGCPVCGVMGWKATASGEMACDQCGNVFDAPIVPESPTPDANAHE